MEMSQLTYDIITYVSFGLVWLPFILALVGFLIWVIILCFKKETITAEYLAKLSDADRKVINQYFDNTNILRYITRTRRIKKNLNANIHKD